MNIHLMGTARVSLTLPTVDCGRECIAAFYSVTQGRVLWTEIHPSQIISKGTRTAGIDVGDRNRVSSGEWSSSSPAVQQWMGMGGIASVGSIGFGDGFEQVAVRVIEVDAPAVVPMINLTALLAGRIGPEGLPS